MLAIDKPIGLSSHDVINRVRKIFSEKRVGHMGTLDPLASGVLLVCVGPATRLNPYITMHDKRYDFTVVFGSATDTDDAEGEIIQSSSIPDEIPDPNFARSFVASLVGKQQQIPPAFSAIKVNGERSYKAARSGNVIQLASRPIEIYQAELKGVHHDLEKEFCAWDISVHVSKGTYIRSLARDIGNALGVPAHVGALRRTHLGKLSLSSCTSLDALERLGEAAALDPLALLGYRFVFANETQAFCVSNGSPLEVKGLKRFVCPLHSLDQGADFCTTSQRESDEAFGEDEIVSVIINNKLAGLYRYDCADQILKPECIFAVGVSRGKDI